MQLQTTINRTNVVIDLPGVTQGDWDTVGNFFNQALARTAVKNRDAIRDAFLTILAACPTANASDLWHHVVMRRYIEIFPQHRNQDAGQSWKRASGEALEIAVEAIYDPILTKEGIQITMLLGKPKKLAALNEMGIQNVVGSDKLDVGLYLLDTGELFGGIHVKASLAERVSDDVPCSRAMMQNGYFSPMWTLDVKSFPPPGDLVNRGELGSPKIPSQKRGYVEIHGDFDNLYSGNGRSAPSGPTTKSGKKVVRIQLSQQPDLFAKEIIARAQMWRQKKKAANPPPPRQTN
jgi:hypothetical protein